MNITVFTNELPESCAICKLKKHITILPDEENLGVGSGFMCLINNNLLKDRNFFRRPDWCPLICVRKEEGSEVKHLQREFQRITDDYWWDKIMPWIIKRGGLK